MKPQRYTAKIQGGKVVGTRKTNTKQSLAAKLVNKAIDKATGKE